MRPIQPARTIGFTLVEILIVVVILGILAAIVIPQFASARAGAEQSSFVTDCRTYQKAATIYMATNSAYLEDSSSGAIPAGFENYINEDGWLDGTPIGGVWDFEYNSFGITAAFGVHFNGTGATRDDAYMTEIDDMLDDGVLTTNGFRKLAADRYYVIIEG